MRGLHISNARKEQLFESRTQSSSSLTANASHQKTFKSNQLLAFSPPTDIITWEMDGNYFLQQWKEKSIQPLQLFIVTIDDDVWKNSHYSLLLFTFKKSTHVS